MNKERIFCVVKETSLKLLFSNVQLALLLIVFQIEEEVLSPKIGRFKNCVTRKNLISRA